MSIPKSLGEPLTADEQTELEEFSRHMEEVVIPEIEETMRLRAKNAEKSRKRFIY